LRPDSENEAEALPEVTVPEVTGVPFTTKVTVPLMIAGPLAGLTVACRVTDEAPNVAAAFDAVIVVAIEDAPMDSVPAPSAKSPLPAVFVARTVNAVEPAGVADVVVIVRVDVAELDPFDKLTVDGLNDALAPAGSAVVNCSEAENALPIPIGPLRVTVTRNVALPAVPAESTPD
jgi:hypothetical protein